MTPSKNPLKRYRWLAFVGLLAVTALACQIVSGVSQSPTMTSSEPTLTSTPAATATTLPPIAVQPGDSNPNEPVFISGEIPYTSPFFINSIAEPFVMLEDEAGFVHRDRQFQFRLNEQIIGPVSLQPDKSLTYSLSLPAVPQGTMVDVDNNGKSDAGVQVFAIAYWSNTWGDPFLEKRDGTGWSNAYASTITDPENKDEIKGGLLVVWVPDDQQSFPTGFGKDGLLFTADDPTAPIPAGYNLVDLNQDPFHVYKQARPTINLNEGEVAVNDYSKMSYSDAFEALFKKVSREYPFTTEKNINWQQIHDEFAPQVAQAKNDTDFYTALHNFTLAIPDEHVGLSFNAEVFYNQCGGSFGLVLKELSDGSVMVSEVLTDTPGSQAGIQPGAVISTWNDQPVSQAIDQVVPYLGPYSAEHTRRLAQVVFLTRVPPDTKVKIGYQNPGESNVQQKTLTAVVEYDSLFKAISGLSQDALALPVEAKILDSGLGYIRITTFSDDYNLMARLWDRYIKNLIDNKVPGLIIDLRSNGGGNSGLALDFAGYFFDQNKDLYRTAYFNERTGKFEFESDPAQIETAEVKYDGPIAVLISPDCVSACEGFAYALKQDGRSMTIGNYPTAGAFGEVGRGQYDLPGGLSMQFPTGRSEAMDGSLLIEGKGIQLDLTVPVTKQSVLGTQDSVLQAAVDALQAKIK